MRSVTSASRKRELQMNVAIFYILISVLGGAVGQVLLKMGMSSLGAMTFSVDHLGNLLWRLATNPLVVGGLMIYACGTLFWLLALSRVDLSFAYPFASLSYVLMLLASWLLLNEHISLTRLAGSFVIIIGVLIISRS
jgi:drug/metabolite transporter (DMT)-like permease